MSRVLNQLLTKSVDEIPESIAQPYVVKPAVAGKSMLASLKRTISFIAVVAVGGGAAYHWKSLPGKAPTTTPSIARAEPASGTVPAGLDPEQFHENEEAINSYYAGNYDEASKHFSRLSKANPTSAALLVNLGMVQRKKGALAEARQQNLAALRLNPKSATAHNNLGVLSAEEKNWDEAIKMFQEALKDDEQRADAYVNLGSVYEQKAEWNNARQAYLAYVAHPAGDPAVKKLLKTRVPKLYALANVPAEKGSP